MKVTLILLDGKNMYFKKSIYDEDKGIGIVKGGRWFRKGVNTRYLLDVADFFYMKKRGGMQPYIIVDSKNRSSIQPHLQDSPNVELMNKLDFMMEPSFWKGLIARVKISTSMVLIILFAGMGIYSLIRLILQAFGYHLP